MADRSVFPPQLAEPDALNNTTSFPNAASVTDADKVINTKLDSSQVEGNKKNEEELLKGLLADDYCHVCEAVLLFESQRLSHYEGKKHAQKLKVYLQTKRAEKLNKESTVPQRTMPSDKDRFCELCNMVFSSHMVAKCHYEGKVHAKNLRKQSFQSPGNFLQRHTDVCTSPRLTHEAEDADQRSPAEGDVEHHEAAAATITTTPNVEVDLNDPNKYCPLCAASFNNPQMAQQHYNGRKHQRNRSKQERIKELGDNVQQANSLMCQVCNLQFDTPETYQAHVHGNKHQFREKRVSDQCKAQQKVYGTFADELADYIQAQKARGITPKTSQVLPQGETHVEGEGDEGKGGFDKRQVELHKPIPSLTPTSDPHQPRPSGYHPAVGRRLPPQGPAWPPHSWDYTCPPPFLPGSGPSQLTSWPMIRRRRRKQSSSSSYTTSASSSYSSSDSSSMSDSDGSEYKRRERRRIGGSKKDRGQRGRAEDFVREERQRKWQMRKERDDEKIPKKREESGEWEQERRRKKKHSKRRRKDKNTEDFKEDGGDGAIDNVKPEDVDNTNYSAVHIQAEINVEEGEGEQDESAKAKCRKKKMKERVDTRTEEEKLWDDSILGC